MSTLIFLILCAVLVSFQEVSAFSDAEKKAINENLKPVAAECAQAHGVSQDEIKEALKAGYDNHLSSCFFACLMKKAGMLNDHGVYNADTGVDLLKNIVSDADLAKYKAKAKQCGSVNSQAVGDGEAGCDRAKLVLACLRKQGLELVF